MSNSRRKRGRETELVGASFFRKWFPFAEAVGSGSPGADLTGTPGVAVEFKAHSTFKPLEWMRQARRNAGAMLPLVVFRANGQGPESVGDWFAITALKEFMDLLDAAGYTDRTESTIQAARRVVFEELAQHTDWSDDR